MLLKKESLAPYFVSQVSPTAFSLKKSYSRGLAQHPLEAAKATLMNGQACVDVSLFKLADGAIYWNLSESMNCTLNCRCV